ncbi:hypothetical protein NB725_004562 [Pantoea ananatis]|nr:hypothetical protein [Pantoea ananatis]MCW0341839.1 hypothetical protein [Pantoea ananatis]MCW0360326.1 hypothetical protein [Pantoea ananatis]MCW0364952.1 hypothetical protein [Pantoea ananatis]
MNFALLVIQRINTINAGSLAYQSARPVIKLRRGDAKIVKATDRALLIIDVTGADLLDAIAA